MDRRDSEYVNGKWYKSFDEKRMVVTVEICGEDDEGDYDEEVEFPAKYEVCDLCHGKGKHVNPGVDAHGISAEEFYEDPDFAEDYMSGTYDVDCYRCGGSRVEPVINEDGLTTDKMKEDFKRLQEYLEELGNSRAQDAYTRRMESGGDY